MGDRDVHLKAVASPFPLFLLYGVLEEVKWQRLVMGAELKAKM